MIDEPLTQAEYDELGQAWSNGPFARYFGFRTTFQRGEKVIIELGDIHAAKLGGKGSDAINGAMLSALFDCSIGCTPSLVAPLRRSATVELAIKFLRRTHGQSARCEAFVDRLTSTLVFATAYLYDEKGVRTAQCSGISALGKPRSFAELKAALQDRPPV